jgi:hypothetical protein
MERLELDIHGVQARVLSADSRALSCLADDFSQFHARTPVNGAAIEVTLIAERPRYDELPPLRATVHSPRNVCYTQGDTTYIDYFGKALSIYDRARQRVEIRCERPHLLHEIAYLTLLSRIGEGLERNGMHRVHALAVGAGGRSALVLLPSTGGKTTLALHFLRHGSDVKLVSEDSPLVDVAGLVHPFPLRLGVLSETPPPFPEEFVTYAERMEFAPKYLVSLRAFPGAIETAVTRPEWLFVGVRTLGRTCRIAPSTRLVGLRALLRDMIVGVGLYQGVEFLLRSSVLDLLRSTGLVAGRARAALALLSRVQVFTLELGLDSEHNARILSSFLHEQGLTTQTHACCSTAP